MDRAGFDARHPHQRGQAAAFGGAYQVLERLRIHANVLEVQDDEVEAGVADHLHQQRRGDGVDQAMDTASGGQARAQFIGPQHGAASTGR